MALTSTFTDRLSLGERLARARKATGKGQRDFSKLVGLSARTVAAYELDQRAPSFETVTVWAHLTGAPVSYFAEAIETPEVRTLAGVRPAPLAAHAASRCVDAPLLAA